MSFGLTIGTDRAKALQDSIQDELTKRGYSVDADPVMAEYITIMVINNKTPAQVTSELEDLIGGDFNPEFTDWIFAEAAKGAAESAIPVQATPSKTEAPASSPLIREPPPHVSNDSSRPNAPRNAIYQQALSQALPSGSNPAQKRTSSARSPSPSHPNKSRRTDLPTGPRAMYRDGSGPNGNPHPNTRSLIERVGGPAGRNSKNFQRDDIQARIDNIVGSAQEPNMMMPPGFPMGMDMNAMAAANMANPLMLQEMMMNQMALMAQMASTMGIINPVNGQFAGQGFPMQGMQGDMGVFQNNINGFPPQQTQQPPGNNGSMNGAGRGRGAIRGGRGTGRGRGGSNAGTTERPIGNNNTANAQTNPSSSSATAPVPIVSPTPITPAPSTPAPSAVARAAAPVPQVQPAYSIPERPQSPTLCKFNLKCTNAHCRYSHPSPVATAESGVVLSNEACEQGKDCKNKDCIKAHVSPAVLNPQAEHSTPSVTIAPAPPVHHAPIPCRFGASCTRPGCTFNHPPRQAQFATQCRFGAACTRAQCAFQHPEGRVLPSSFHRGLSTTGPVSTPETGVVSQNRSVTFNNPASTTKQKLEQQMKEVQERKNQAEQAVKDAEAAVAGNKKADTNPVSIAA